MNADNVGDLHAIDDVVDEKRWSPLWQLLVWANLLVIPIAAIPLAGFAWYAFSFCGKMGGCSVIAPLLLALIIYVIIIWAGSLVAATRRDMPLWLSVASAPLDLVLAFCIVRLAPF